MYRNDILQVLKNTAWYVKSSLVKVYYKIYKITGGANEGNQTKFKKETANALLGGKACIQIRTQSTSLCRQQAKRLDS